MLRNFDIRVQPRPSTNSSIFWSGGRDSRARAYFPNALRNFRGPLVDFPGRLRYRTHDHVHFADGELSDRSEVGCAKLSARLLSLTRRRTGLLLTDLNELNIRDDI